MRNKITTLNQLVKHRDDKVFQKLMVLESEEKYLAEFDITFFTFVYFVQTNLIEQLKILFDFDLLMNL